MSILCKKTPDYIAYTPFYRAIIDRTSSKWVDEPEVNYNSYDIFGLNSLLSYWIKHKWNINVFLEFPTVIGKGAKSKLQYITVVPKVKDVIYQMSEEQYRQLQYKIDEITSKNITHIFLISFDPISIKDDFDNSIVVSSGWLKSIYPYLGISQELNPYISEMGLMVDLSAFNDYMTLYGNLLINVIQRIKDMYLQGYIVDPSNYLIENWGLRPILLNEEKDDKFKVNSLLGYKVSTNTDIEIVGSTKLGSDNIPHLYVTTWNDHMITKKYGGIQGFLSSLDQNNPTVDLYVGYKLLSKHNVAKYMSSQRIPFLFSDSYVRINVDNIKDIQSISSIINIETSKGQGKVVEMKTTRLSWNMIYMSIAEKMGYENNVSYLTDDVERPCVFSSVVPLETDEDDFVRILNITSREIASRFDQEILTDINISMNRQSFVTQHDLLESNVEEVGSTLKILDEIN